MLIRPPAAFTALLCAFAAPSFADDAAASLRTVTVVGHGQAQARPDTAVVQVGVETEGSTAGTALADNTKRMTALVAAAKQAGVADRDVRTTSFSVFPVYGEAQPGKEPRIASYRVANEVMIRTKKIEALGALLDKLVSTGANQIRGVSFSIEDDAKLRDAARKDAMADAARKAAQLAGLGGAALGPVHTLREHEGGGGPIGPMREMAMSAKAVPIEAGESIVALDVEVTWLLR